jgi:hypothetical protein
VLTRSDQVKILLAEKENKYSHQSDKRRHKRAEFQIEMLKHQEEIAFRAKRDNTVLKVIAVLTALFLPGAFIAVISSCSPLTPLSLPT